MDFAPSPHTLAALKTPPRFAILTGTVRLLDSAVREEAAVEDRSLLGHRPYVSVSVLDAHGHAGPPVETEPTAACYRTKTLTLPEIGLRIPLPPDSATMLVSLVDAAGPTPGLVIAQGRVPLPPDGVTMQSGVHPLFFTSTGDHWGVLDASMGVGKATAAPGGGEPAPMQLPPPVLA